MQNIVNFAVNKKALSGNLKASIMGIRKTN
jgi:hypothetical protein